MTITLRPDLEKEIARAIESGAYQSPDEVIERALQVLRSEDEWLVQNKDVINPKISEGLAQLERGEGISPEELRANLDRRKAAFLAEQKI